MSKKIFVPVVMIVVLLLSWKSFFSGVVENTSGYHASIRKAEESVEERLYEQAIEYYKESLEYKQEEQTYLLIKETYDALYAEEHTAFFRSCYIEDMAAAAQLYPKNEVFWRMQVELHLEANNANRAFKVLKDAMNQSVESEYIRAKYKELLYSVKVGYKSYSDFKTALNGYISVFDGEKWKVINDLGDQIISEYDFVGLINDEGKGIYRNSIDTRLLDATEVTRRRFDVEVEDAGYYNEYADLVPVKINGMWRYMDSAGEFLPGEFEVAGSYYGKEAVACRNGTWVLLDTEGNQSELSQFEDIKLDLYGCHIQNEVIIAKADGKYGLYDTEFNRIGDFSADDMDICIDSSGIAFSRDGKWGFVDADGNEVLAPVYDGAKSMANGYAAVRSAEGLWGFVNSRFELVIDHAYLDAHYLTSSETCMVSTMEGKVQMLEFVFD